LSACETAEGDERAALGLAGLAVKAGARSALGTLWRVNDEAARELIVEFYSQLKTDSGVSKAEALRRAQRKILEGRFDHPQYWSAFLLISNWL
jgi:CHAT domain-containing protein